MHAQCGVLDETCLYVVSARDNPEQARIWRCLVVATIDHHFHSAANRVSLATAVRVKMSSCEPRGLSSCVGRSSDCAVSKAARLFSATSTWTQFGLISTRQTKALTMALIFSGTRAPSSSAI